MTKITKQIDSLEFYQLTSEEKDKYQKFVIAKIEEEKDKYPLYAKMEKTFHKVANRYFSDFYVHDYNKLTKGESAGGKFIWNVYECGSRLIRLDNDFEEDTNSNYDFYTIIVNGYFNQKNMLYIVDLSASSITEVNTSKVIATMFTHRCGTRQAYINELLNKLDLEDYYVAKECCHQVMDEYSNNAPKTAIDKAIASYIRKTA